MSSIIVFPEVFMLKDQYIDDVIAVLRQIYYAKHAMLFFDLSKTKEIRKGDYMVLTAQMEKVRKTQHVSFLGIGKKPDCINDMRGEVIRWSKDLPASFNKVEKTRFLTPQITETITNDLKRIGINRKDPNNCAFFERIDALITEIIANAIEHGIRSRKINCWMTTEIDRIKKMVIFTFVDMGQGIAKSHRNAGLPLRYLFAGDRKIVKDSIMGKLMSSTKHPYRGQGLPEIKSIVEGELVSDFHLITNKTVVTYTDNQFSYKKIPDFVGTYYSWSITKQNRNNFKKWKSIQ